MLIARSKQYAVALLVSGSFAFSGAAHAVLGEIPTAGVATASLVAATGITGTGGGVAIASVNKDNYWGLAGGLLISAGGIGLGFVDPPSATYYSGSFTLHYAPSLMEVMQSGWLGTWGQDTTLAAPPDDPTQWGAGVPVYLQNANAGLTAVVNDDPTSGMQTVAFNWAGGHVDSAGPFNIFGTAFRFTQDVHVSLLGNGIAPPADANFYVSTPGFSCVPPNGTMMETCGESATQYYRIEAVPEPSSNWLALCGCGLLALAVRRIRSV